MAQQAYRTQIGTYETKSSQAYQANQKVLAKYDSLKKHIAICGGSQAQILNFLPKVQVSQFIEQNKKDFEELGKGDASIKQKMNKLDQITGQLKAFFTKLNLQQLVQTYFRDGNQDKSAATDKIFAPAYKMIEEFNAVSKSVEEDAKKVGDISIQLNKKNQGDESAKK